MRLFYVPWNPNETIETDESLRSLELFTFDDTIPSKPTKRPFPPKGSLVAWHNRSEPPPIRGWIYDGKEWDVQPQEITRRQAIENFGVRYTARIISQRTSFNIMPM